GYAAVEVGGIGRLRREREYLDRFQTFRDAVTVRWRLNQLVFRAVNAQHEGYDIEVLRSRIRPIATRLARFVISKGTDTRAYEAASSEIREQERVFHDEGIEPTIPPEEKQRRA